MNQENKYIIDELEHVSIPLPSDSYFEELKKNVLREIQMDGSKKNTETRMIPIYKR